MSDKVREALFNIIGSVDGWRVIDAYAGSGAIGLEALSRGARSVTLIEAASEPLQAIARTIAALGSEETARVIPGKVEGALSRLGDGEFDLIVADPPYDKLSVNALDGLATKLAPGGVLVVSHASRNAAPELKSMERFDTRSYGDSSLSLYRLDRIGNVE